MLKSLCCLLLVQYTKCVKILGVFPAPGYSQFILGEALMTELAKGGHDVTVISPYTSKMNLSNYNTISTEGLLEHTQGFDFFRTENSNFMKSIRGSQLMGLKITEYTLSAPAVQDLLHSSDSFDLVIVEQFFSNALMGLAKHFDAPLIVFSSLGPSEWTNNLMGNFLLPSYMPLTKMNFSTGMKFFQRLKNSMAFLFDLIYKHYVIYPQHDLLLKKYYPKEMELEDVMYNVSLILLNSHYTITQPFPLVVGMVEIGGFHIKQESLPVELQNFLDGASDGAIYFSMGTNLKMSLLERNKLQSIISVFSTLKQRVLWKFDGVLPKLPPNIMVINWVPQHAVLAHPNVKLFVSHGGLLSLTESVYFGVPMIGIPIFGDQKMNIAKAVEFGFAFCVPFRDLNEETLSHALREVLGESRYRNSVKSRSRLYHDQIVKPLNVAVYWIEHVIGNRGGSNLKFAGQDLKWYQFYILDVLVFCMVLLITVMLSIKYLFKKCIGFRRTDKTKLH